jgi:hypothetical protein
MRDKGFVALLALVLCQGDLPGDASAFMRRVRDAVLLDYELQEGYAYLEHRRDVKISRLGRLTIGPQRTFEVFPSGKPGHTYKRLIAVEGKPLPPEELARRDAEHEKNLREAAERERNETPKQRKKRLDEEAEELAERNAILDDALAVYQPVFAGRESVDGQAVIVATITPRPGARVTTRQGRWFKQFAGRVWIGEADHQIVRLEMTAIDDVTIGWGIIGRVHKGSRFVFARRRFENVWLPAEVIFEASGRTMLFRRFQFSTTTTYSGYRRVAPR